MTEPELTPPPPVPFVPGPAVYAEPVSPPAGPITTALPAQPPMPQWSPPPKQKRTGLFVALAVLAALVLVGAGVIGGVMFSSGKSPVDAVKGAVGSKTFIVSGTLTLQDADGYTASSTCSGKRGYDDIGEGAQVTVSDSSGSTIAISRLGAGKVQSFGCVFDFSVPDVPAGKGFYGLEVSHRGVLNYSEAEISGKAITLTLG